MLTDPVLILQPKKRLTEKKWKGQDDDTNPESAYGEESAERGLKGPEEKGK